MMLQAEAGDMIAQRKQKVIIAIVPRSEQHACLLNQLIFNTLYISHQS
jgi:hypothetical protein